MIKSTIRAIIAVVKTFRYSIAPNHLQSVYKPTNMGPMNKRTAMTAAMIVATRGGRFNGAAGVDDPKDNASSNQIVRI